MAKLLRKPARPPIRAAMAIGAWTGVYRSCDRGRSWIGSAVPGSPLDNSDASLASPLKQLSILAEQQGGHAETTDPVLVAGPSGRMHLVVLGFVRFPGGAVGESRMYYVSYTDRNNREGGTCFHYDFMRVIDTAVAHQTSSSTLPFIDKPAVAVDRDGTLYVAYTVFLDSVRSRIVVARSTNGGGTWQKTTPLLNLGFLRNHGTTLTIDPLNGVVYLAWRMFYNEWPLMVISKSYDKGRTFWPATPISHFWPAKSLTQIIQQLKAARLQPYDQFTATGSGDEVTARSLAFPSITAGVVNGRTKLFAAWTERADISPGSPTFGQPLAGGSPRVMLSMSSDGGWTWTPRRAIDAGPRTEHQLQVDVGGVVQRRSAPQLQPVLSISGRTNPQLLLLYYEAREELQPPFDGSFASGITRMMDVRAARINPATGSLLAPSVQVSEYPVRANSSPAAIVTDAGGNRAAHRQNLTMYAGGTAAFFGDYPNLSPAVPFEYTNGWQWTNEPGTALAMWTDNRDVEFPRVNGVPDVNGIWTTYTPLVPTVPGGPMLASCEHVASRNANPYFTEIGGVIAGAPQSFKRLTVQRAFATYVENRTPNDRFFRLTIQDNEAAGLDASFDQFAFGNAADQIDIHVFRRSSQHRTVWVQPLPSRPTASLTILVREISAIGGTLLANGLRSRIVLNPDPNNDTPTTVPPLAPEFANDPRITADNSELHNPQISTPQISTFKVGAPQISSPQISSPQISSPQISSPQISTPQISSPQISTPQISTPAPDAGDTNGTDVTFTVTNQGNTTSTYDAIFNVPNVEALMREAGYQFQVLVSRTSREPGFIQNAGRCEPAIKAEEKVITSVPVPQISSPQISTIQNPQISSPQISTPQISTFSLAPAGGAEGQNSHGDAGNEDNHSLTLPDSVNVTLRAIKTTRPVAGEPVFDPAVVQIRVTAQSTNVVVGVVQPDGTQPSTTAQPDLLVLNYAPNPDGLAAAPGGQVTLSGWTLANQGSAIVFVEGSFSSGYYLSTDPIIDPEDILLAQFDRGNFPAGGLEGIPGPTLTLPAGIAPGPYFIGILVDDLDNVSEANETNNWVSEPITIAAAPGGPGVVTNTNDEGAGSLRQAIASSNSSEGPTLTITFSIPGPGPHVIAPASALPPITRNVVIDATTQPGFDGTPVVILDGAGMEIGAGLTVGAPSTIRGLSIVNFPGPGVFINDIEVGGTVVVGNYIGLTPDAVSAGNAVGVQITGSPNNVIGGTALADRNVISGNTGPAIAISQDDGQGAVIQGNYIGTDPIGTSAVPNGVGIQVADAEFVTIGGTAPGAGNVISGNSGSGISLQGDASVATIQGNRIGLTAPGAAALPNAGNGITISETPGTTIGGTTTEARNYISGNTGYAVAVSGADSTGTIIQGNWIGTDLLQSNPVPNDDGGLLFSSGASGVIDDNTILDNAGPGITVLDTQSVDIRNNVLSDNEGLGIDLGGDGLTANDAADADVGANLLQNFPVLDSAVSLGEITVVQGELNSAANTTFTIRLFRVQNCDPSGQGEGSPAVEGVFTVVTDEVGTAPIQHDLQESVPVGWFITATATDPAGNTSELSACRVVQGGA
jgi:parallel beta-helix repeat protein